MRDRLQIIEFKCGANTDITACVCACLHYSLCKTTSRLLLSFFLCDCQIIMPSACDSVIEDIEDMVSFNDPTPQDRQSARKSIIPRSRKKKDGNHEELLADRSVKQLL